jgi:hypothetical protein
MNSTIRKTKAVLKKLYHEITRYFTISEHDNRATAGFAADSTFADAVLPMALLLKEVFSLEVADFYEEGYIFDYIDTEPRSQSDEANTASMLFKNNIITRNESRLRVGAEAIYPLGDVFVDGSTIKEIKDNSIENIDDIFLNQ